MKGVGVLDFTGERIVPQADNCEPNFASRMMHEHLVRYLFAGQLVGGKAVLDVGCGVGYGAQRLAQLGAASVTAFDISADAVTHAATFYAHPAVRFLVADAEDFALDAQFDVVTCFEMIEHVTHPDRVLACIRRHLKPDGILVASTPRFLGEKRTHFHVREFSLDEYEALVKASFPNTMFYFENNHFSSLITADPAEKIERIAYLKDQFAAAQADVFISVSCGPGAQQPTMLPSVVFDDDRYVQMLERDVAILHKAEDDVRAQLDAERQSAGQVAAFKDAEIARLVAEYNGLFKRSADEQAQLVAAHRDTESGLIARHAAAMAQADATLAAAQQEIARLQDDLAKAHAQAQVVQQAQQDEIDRLTREGETFRTQAAETLTQLKALEMKLAEQEQQQAALEKSVESLRVRLGDADARRLEAYEFARQASDETQALRRELEILKRDLAEALDTPDVVQPVAADPRHRDIVEAMERLFLGTEATHAVARNPLVLRVAALAAANRRLAAEIEQIRADVHEQRVRADRAEAFAQDWHDQIMKLRNSGSWKATKPLRALGRLFG